MVSRLHMIVFIPIDAHAATVASSQLPDGGANSAGEAPVTASINALVGSISARLPFWLIPLWSLWK